MTKLKPSLEEAQAKYLELKTELEELEKELMLLLTAMPNDWTIEKADKYHVIRSKHSCIEDDLDELIKEYPVLDAGSDCYEVN